MFFFTKISFVFLLLLRILLKMNIPDTWKYKIIIAYIDANGKTLSEMFPFIYFVPRDLVNNGTDDYKIKMKQMD